ncbi:MAG: hypothetical protein P8L16_02435 [Ilumatobacter sp.]|nr:hypothetical protein [Ilumatobacter sp.]MDG2232653.1 hypothetical protein [Ilumatobacter sp.]
MSEWRIVSALVGPRNQLIEMMLSAITAAVIDKISFGLTCLTPDGSAAGAVTGPA